MKPSEIKPADLPACSAVLGFSVQTLFSFIFALSFFFDLLHRLSLTQLNHDVSEACSNPVFSNNSPNLADPLV
jgi:hypothetical protein